MLPVRAVTVVVNGWMAARYGRSRADTIDLNEFAARRVPALSSAGKSIVDRGERDPGGDHEADSRRASRLRMACLTGRRSVANGRRHASSDPASEASQTQPNPSSFPAVRNAF